jgi:hypothetical protein
MGCIAVLVFEQAWEVLRGYLDIRISESVSTFGILSEQIGVFRV